MRYYFGWLTAAAPTVVAVLRVDDEAVRPLLPRLDLWQYHEGLYQVGRHATREHLLQLSLAILSDALDHDQMALDLHEAFAIECISQITCDNPWRLLWSDVMMWVAMTMAGCSDEVICLADVPDPSVN